jgi:TRAP-type C4-dicarboxylate transport system permease small subunit
MKKLISVLKAIQTGYRKFETGVLTVFLSIMLIVSVLQIFLRVSWFDPLLKYLVLWAGMIAAGIATVEYRHIKIDLVGRFVRGRVKTLINLFARLFAAVVCGILTVGFILYIFPYEFEATDPAPFLNIPRWVLMLVLPYSFFVMMVRFLIQTVTSLISFIRKKDDRDESILDQEIVKG